MIARTDAIDLLQQSAAGLATLIARREVTSEEITHACLERIAELEPKIGAWEWIDPEAALAQARSRDAARSIEREARSFWGVPIAVKDVIDTVDMPTAYGSPIYRGHRPAADADCVARLRQAGAVILGKTVTTEFAAVYHPGKTKNPYDATRTPGGSSSGSAAGIAVGMVPVGIGTQAGGSVLRPASYCGVFAFKPTFGAVSRGGIWPIRPSFDTVGVLARAVEDLATAAQAMHGRDPADPATQLVEAIDFEPRSLDSAPRIGVVRTSHWDDADDAAQRAIAAAAEAFSASGAVVEEVTLPAEFEWLLEMSIATLDFEEAEALGEEYNRHPSKLGDATRELVERGRAVPRTTHLNGLKLASGCRPMFHQVMHDFTCLLTLVAHGEAPSFETTGDPLFCRLWTLLGCPAVSVPGLIGPHGLPIGVQLVGAHSEDGRLLGAASWAAEALPAAASPPQVPTS